MTANGILVRRGQESDIEPVLAIADSTPTAPRWSRGEYRRYCMPCAGNADMLPKALFVACVAETLAPIARKIVGFAAFSAISASGECELENMAVAEKWRRQGAGKALMTAGVQWCRAWSGCSLRLEVRASNLDAIRLYRQAGFTATGTRWAYYSGPVEDAILMHKALDPALPPC